MDYIHPVPHPLPLGTKVLSLRGEKADDENGDLQETGPNTVGKVISVDYSPHAQGWTYGIVFQPNDVWVFIDQLDSIDDPDKYRILELGVPEERSDYEPKHSANPG